MAKRAVAKWSVPKWILISFWTALPACSPEAKLMRPASAFDASRAAHAQDADLESGQRSATADFGQVHAVRGQARFVETSDGVRISVALRNAPPGYNALRIHEGDDCSDMRRGSMGQEFAPRNLEKRQPGSGRVLIGDLGTITIGRRGSGSLELLVREANLSTGHAFSLIGKSLVMYAEPDVDARAGRNLATPIACAPIESS